MVFERKTYHAKEEHFHGGDKNTNIVLQVVVVVSVTNKLPSHLPQNVHVPPLELDMSQSCTTNI
jgi:hypothetical protein